MLVGIITGSGTHALPDFEDAAPERIDTPWGAADVTRGRFAGVDAVHLSRHDEGHVRLSNHVNHRANIAALKEAGCAAVVGCTACGAVDGDIPLGSLDHVRRPALPRQPARGRLDLLVLHEEGDPRAATGSTRARSASVRGRRSTRRGRPASRRATAAATATSTDRASTRAPRSPARGGRRDRGVADRRPRDRLVRRGRAALRADRLSPPTTRTASRSVATPVEELMRLIGATSGGFAAVLAGALPGLDAETLPAAGVVYRFERG